MPHLTIDTLSFKTVYHNLIRQGVAQNSIFISPIFMIMVIAKRVCSVYSITIKVIESLLNEQNMKHVQFCPCFMFLSFPIKHGRIQRGRQGVRTPPPLKNHRNIGFPSNIYPNPLKIHKATKPACNAGPSWGRQRSAI